MLHDPFLMKDMDKAISRINKAMDNEKFWFMVIMMWMEPLLLP